AIDAASIFGPSDSDVDFSLGLGWNHIGSGASADHSDVQRQTTLKVSKTGDALNLPCKLDNSAVSLAWIQARVCGNASHTQPILPDTFVSSLHGSPTSGGWL